MVEVVDCSLKGLVRAAEIVGRGGVIVYPTDTVYGLGCNPYRKDAVERIFRVKGRGEDKPLPVLVAGPHEALRIAEFSSQALKVSAFFWPGGLTLILRRKPAAPAHLGGRELIGIRWPRHREVCRLIMLCGGLLVGTSANPTGEEPARTAGEALESLGREVDLVVDGGKTPESQPSTVLDLSAEKPRILREGCIPAGRILGELDLGG